MPSIIDSFYHPQTSSADSERTNPAQDKAKLQRQYRAKEAVAILELQKLIRDISGGADDPQTRLETIVQGKLISRTNPNCSVA